MTIVLNGTTGITNDGGYTGDGISFADTTPANTLVTTTSGNVGIGTSSPADKLVIAGGNLLFSGSNFVYSYAGGTSAQVRSGINFDGTNTKMEFYTAQAERMRINSDGKLLVNTTTDRGQRLQVSGGGIGVVVSANGSGGIDWYNASGGYVASVIVNSGSVAYNTTSDYRLKENVTPMTGALDKVQALKPVTWSWKNTGEQAEGFIAHELAEVCPDAVSGEKDAVDAEGNPKYQGVDTSFLVATLTAAIQEQQAIITDLKSRVEALENK